PLQGFVRHVSPDEACSFYSKFEAEQYNDCKVDRTSPMADGLPDAADYWNSADAGAERGSNATEGGDCRGPHGCATDSSSTGCSCRTHSSLSRRAGRPS